MLSRLSTRLLTAICALAALSSSANAQTLPVNILRATGSAHHSLLYGSQVETFDSSHDQVTGEFRASRTTVRGHPARSLGYVESRYRNVHSVDLEGQPVNYLELSGQALVYARMFEPDPPDQIALSAQSRALLVFSVLEPLLYEFSGSVGLIGQGFGNGGAALLVSGQLTPLGHPDIFRETFTGSGSQRATFTGQGTLAPGVYFFEARAAASALALEIPAYWYNVASYELRITLSPIPAPGAAVCMLLSIALVPTRRR